MFTSEFHWTNKTCEVAYPRFATNPVYVVCLYACVLCVLSARVMCMCGYLTLQFNEAAAIHSPWTDVADSQGRIHVQTAIAIHKPCRAVNKQEDLAPEDGLLSDEDLREGTLSDTATSSFPPPKDCYRWS